MTSPSEKPSAELPDDLTLPLRDRVPEYLTVFGLMWVVIVAVGITVGLLTSASLLEGIAYVALVVALALLLSGGASGGGYTSLGMGAVGAIFGGRQRHDEDYEDEAVRRGAIKRVNTGDRLRRGLRPERNPRAFWQVIAGFVNLAAAMVLLTAFG